MATDPRDSLRLDHASAGAAGREPAAFDWTLYASTRIKQLEHENRYLRSQNQELIDRLGTLIARH